MQAILFLHGRGRKPDAETLRSQWLASLPQLPQQHDEEMPIGMVYWADLLPNFPATEAEIEWLSGHLAGQAYLQIDGKPGLGHDDVAGKDFDRGRGDEVVADLAAYFRPDPVLRNALRERVRDAIVHVAEHVDRLLLISHELGSVIAYEVLTHRRYLTGGGHFEDIGDETRAKISLVTLGSPLGWVYDAELVHYVRRSGKTYPRRLKAWTNVFDERDPFPAPPLLGDHTLADDFMDHEHAPIDHSVQNPEPMPNSVYGYLTAEAVRQVVADFMGRPAPAMSG